MFHINTTTHFLLTAILGVLIVGVMPEIRYVGYALIVIGAPAALARMTMIEFDEIKSMLKKEG